MENKLFENAYFGKPYKTRDSRKAIFYNHHNTYAREKANYVTMILEEEECIYRWYYDGKAADSQEHLDIISEWEEPVDEENLNRLTIAEYPLDDGIEEAHWNAQQCKLREAYKAGYRKAKEE